MSETTEQFTPFKDRVLVEREEVQERTQGGLFVPKTSQEKPLRGHVIEIGPEVSNIKKGERILFGKYSGQEVEVNFKKFVLLRAEEILGTINTVGG